jgi:hypothetical protein
MCVKMEDEELVVVHDVSREKSRQREADTGGDEKRERETNDREERRRGKAGRQTNNEEEPERE